MIILASASPRRKALLESAGIKFQVIVANSPEIHQHDELPEDYVQRLAERKARSVAEMVPPGSDETFIIAADTIVVCDHHILEKPADTQDAFEMLDMLRNRSHHVMTGVCILRLNSEEKALFVTKTEVHFGNYSNATIHRYIATGEPLDKAGAYGIQGTGGCLVAGIEGSYSNVVGLPLHETLTALEKLGAIETLIQ